jgi:hypothetical protein
MDFDFLNEFKDFATSDLLLIVGRPEKYQPEAVEAAKTIHDTRQQTRLRDCCSREWLA